jgi:hypothetical protein
MDGKKYIVTITYINRGKFQEEMASSTPLRISQDVMKPIVGVCTGSYLYAWTGKKPQPFVVSDDAWLRRSELEKKEIVFEGLADR